MAVLKIAVVRKPPSRCGRGRAGGGWWSAERACKRACRSNSNDAIVIVPSRYFRHIVRRIPRVSVPRPEAPNQDRNIQHLIGSLERAATYEATNSHNCTYTNVLRRHTFSAEQHLLGYWNGSLRQVEHSYSLPSSCTRHPGTSRLSRFNQISLEYTSRTMSTTYRAVCRLS